MNDSNEHCYFVCHLKRETRAAYLVELKSTGDEMWVPKSLCELHDNHDGGSKFGALTLEVESWFAKKEMEG